MTESAYRPLLTVPQVAEILGKSAQTVRNWTDEFGTFLSPSANINESTSGRHRFYEREDIAKLMMVNELREAKYRAEEIAISLRNPSTWNKYLNYVEERGFALQIVDSENKRLEIDLALTTRELQARQAEIERLQALVEASTAAREENIRLKAQAESLQEQLIRAAGFYQEIIQKKETEVERIREQLGKMQNTMADQREALGGLGAVKTQLEQTQQHYATYYQHAEAELQRLRELNTRLQAEILFYQRTSGSPPDKTP